MIPLLVPLFVSAFRRANDLAMAMEARCYQGGDNRTKMKPLKYHKRDSISYGILLVYLAGIILLGKDDIDRNAVRQGVIRRMKRVWLTVAYDGSDTVAGRCAKCDNDRRTTE